MDFSAETIEALRIDIVLHMFKLLFCSNSMALGLVENFVLPHSGPDSFPGEMSWRGEKVTSFML